MRIRFLLLLSFVCLASLAWGQRYYGVEPAPLKASVPFSAALRNSLDPQGARLIGAPDDDKILLCELWWSKTVSAYSKTVGPVDSSYGNLQKGTLLGVIYFPAQVSDARGQKLRPGYYTMRYVQMPQDRAHRTVIAYPDFVALSPAASDEKNRETLPLSTLLLLSRRASRTRHPAVMSLVPVNPGYSDFPGIVPDETGQAVLQVKIKIRTGSNPPQELKLAIVLVPTPKGDMAS
jgi:hypothetical protein